MDHTPLPAIPLVDARADPLALAESASVRALRVLFFGTP
jgi:hypothetical protein